MEPGEVSEQLNSKDRGPDTRQQPQFSAALGICFPHLPGESYYSEAP